MLRKPIAVGRGKETVELRVGALLVVIPLFYCLIRSCERRLCNRCLEDAQLCHDITIPSDPCLQFQVRMNYIVAVIASTTLLKLEHHRNRSSFEVTSKFSLFRSVNCANVIQHERFWF